MPNVVKLLRSTTSGAAPSTLVSGQIAINEADGKLFWLDANGVTIRSVTLKDLDTIVAGKLAKTSNLSDLDNAATARSNLGLGAAAMQPLGAFLQAANSLSDLSNTATARNNLGLGTAATRNAGTVANEVALIDSSGALSNQKTGGAAGWGVKSKCIGVSNESGIFFDASNNASLEGRDGNGSLRTRWQSQAEGSHLVDGQPAFVCRAWVNFNGSTGVIRASGNVSSVTRNGGADYTVNFTNPMPNANYAVVVSRSRGDPNAKTAVSSTGITTTSVRVFTGVASVGPGWEDAEHVFVSIFR